MHPYQYAMQRRVFSSMEGGGGGGGQTPPPNGAEGAEGANNSGTVEVPKAFWNPGRQQDAPPANQPQPQQAPPQAKQPSNPMEALQRHIEGFDLGTAFTPDTMEALQSGDPAKLNEALTTMHRNTIMQSVALAGRLLDATMSKFKPEMEQMISTRMQTADSRKALSERFEFANNPQFKPITEAVYGTALQHTKGDSQAAMAVTDALLSSFGEAIMAGKQTNTPSGTPGAGSFESNSNMDWTQEFFGLIREK